MINKDLRCSVISKISFSLTPEQDSVLTEMLRFIEGSEGNSIYLLKGYAGTGKTTIVGALIKALKEQGHKVVLLAPTGRAAKIFSIASDTNAYTIHRCIYRQRVFDGSMNGFELNTNLHRNTLFLTDEASLIARNVSGEQAVFGSGRLLDDLVHYVYAGSGCRLLLMGDDAQLPPVGSDESMAMDASFLSGYGLTVTEGVLTGVHRQMNDSGILWNAHSLRNYIFSENRQHLPLLRISGFPDIEVVTGDCLIEELERAYYEAGLEETIVLTRSNKRAYVYNQGIRGRILGHEEVLSSGDWLVVAKNNYHWIDKTLKAMSGMDFIANGDMMRVRKVRRCRQLYGFDFADVLLEFPDYEGVDIEATVLLNTLWSEGPALTPKELESLFQSVWADYPEFTSKKARMDRVKSDDYFNALQIKYAYAVTCHKAQGGQWQRVFVDQGYLMPDQSPVEYARWLYTAITRARDKVYLVNWPASQIE